MKTSALILIITSFFFRSLALFDFNPIPAGFKDALTQRGLNITVERLQVNISGWLDITEYLESKRYNARRRLYFYNGTRYCRLCWKDENTRYFRILWRYPFVLFCPVHGTPLEEICEKCGENLFDRTKLGDLTPNDLLHCQLCSQSLVEDVIERPNYKIAKLQQEIINTLLTQSQWANPERYLACMKSYIAIYLHYDKTKLKILKLMKKVLQVIELTRNLQSQYVCPICEKTKFANTSSYYFHIWGCGKKRRCPICDRTAFGTKLTYKYHIWGCGKEHKCPSCGKKDFNNKITYDDHIWACEKKHRCPSCGKKDFSTRRQYNDHVWACGKEHKCPNCGKADFSTRNNFDNHVWVCGKVRKCPNCGRTNFSSRASYYNHFWACGKEHKCSNCGRNEFPSRGSYQDHVWACGKEHDCPSCDRTDFPSKSGFYHHIRKCGSTKKKCE